MTGGSSNTFWDDMVNTTTWDAYHWAVGWIPAAFIAWLVCKRLCSTRSWTRVILTMVTFVIVYWAYVLVIMLMALLGFCLVSYDVCKPNRRLRPYSISLGNLTWRRRSSLVVMRARRRSPKGNRGRCLEWFVSRRSGMRDGLALPFTVRDTGGVVAFVPSSINGDSFQQLVIKVVDLPEEGVFRKIVSYL